MNRNIWEYLDHCHSLGLESQLVTNGLLLTPQKIDLLLKHHPSYLRISAQILNPTKHEEVRGVKMNFTQYLDRVADCTAKFIDENHQTKEFRVDIAINDDRLTFRRYVAQNLGIREPGDPTIYNPTIQETRPYVVKLLQLIEKKSRTLKLSIEQVDSNIENFYSKPTGNEGSHLAYDFGNNIMMTYKLFFNGRRQTQYYPIQSATCQTRIIGILANGNVTLCCIDYEGGTTVGNIFEKELSSIIEKNRGIIRGLHETGDLHFDLCKKCLGCPTKHGSFIFDKAQTIKRSLKLF